MTVSKINPVNNYTGDSSTTRFDFDFLIENEKELLVQHTDSKGVQTTLTLDKDYSIDEVGNKNGSYITFPLKDSEYKLLAEDEIISLSLELDIEQDKEYANSSKLSLITLEWSFDYLTRLLQIMNRKISRSVKVQEGSSQTADELVEALQEAKVNASAAAASAASSAQAASKSAIQAGEEATEATQKTAEIQEIYDEAMKNIQEEAEKQREKIQALGFYQKEGKFYYIDEKGEEKQLQFEKTDSLFDLIPKDHILSYEEKEGFELLGEYVYKEAQDGRYGYPDFYEKCIEEFSAKENKTEKIYVSSNITTIGNISDREGILSGFSTSNFAVTPEAFAPEATDNWEMVFKIKIPDTVSQNGAIIGNSTNNDFQGLFISIQTSKKIQLNLTSNGTSWDVVSGGVSTNTLESNTWYYVRIKGTSDNQQFTYVLDVSKDKQIWDEFLNYSEKSPIHKATIPYAIGMDNITSSLKPFCGDIDLNESYIKIGDEIFWQGVKTVEIIKNLNGHRFYDIKDKDKIDKVYTDTGIAWYYGIDEENKRILLPRNDYFFQNNTQVGKYIGAGLPNIIGHFGNFATDKGTSASGAFKIITNYISHSGNVNSGGLNCSIDLNASGSNAVYGNSQTVQPPSVSVAVYMVVGNISTIKKASTIITDITTSENDTIPLFSAMYFDFKPNHVSWLKAGTEASGKVYETAYNELVKCLNEEDNKYNLKVIKTSDMLPDTDYSEYWIINKDNITFQVPLKTSLLNTISNTRILIEKKEPTKDDPNGYNLYSDGWLEQFLKPTPNANSNTVLPLIKAYKDTNYSIVALAQANYEGNMDGWNATPTSINSITFTSGYGTKVPYWIQTSGYAELPTAQQITDSQNIGLYFKLANAVQNIELIDAGKVLEELSAKPNFKQALQAPFPGTTRVPIPLGATGTYYTAPEDGWYSLEKFADANYQFIVVRAFTEDGKTNIWNFQQMAVPGVTASCMLPFFKNQKFRVDYTTTGNVVNSNFIYAKGVK